MSVKVWFLLCTKVIYYNIHDCTSTDGVAETCDGCKVSYRGCDDIFSGADRVLPLGFARQPRLVFLHGPNIPPTASTCALEFRLPTVHTDSVSFKEALITGIKGHGGFGQV